MMTNLVANLWPSCGIAGIMAITASYWGMTLKVSWRSRVLVACIIVVLSGLFSWYDGNWTKVDDVYVGLWTVVAYIDWKEQIIPNRWVIGTLTWRMITMSWVPPLVASSIATGLGLLGFYFLVHFVTRGGLGMGDVKFSGSQGMALGWPQGLLASVIGLWAAGLFSLILLLVFRRSRSQTIALGPFLVMGGFAGLLGILH